MMRWRQPVATAMKTAMKEVRSTRIGGDLVYLQILVFALCLLLSAPARADCTPPSDGLIGHWKLDETSGTTAVDATGVNNGTMTGGLSGTNTIAGMVGTGLNFDGTNDYISVANESNFDFQRSDSFTLSAWVYRESNGEDDIIEKVNPSGYVGYALWFQSGQNTVTLNINGGGAQTIAVDTVATVPNNEWHHIAATYNGNSNASGTRIYIDGVNQALGVVSNTLTTNNILNDYNLLIGDDVTANNCCEFDGRIDDARVYNRALSAEEVAALYATRATASVPAGYMGYDARYSSMVYCNGTNWVRAGIGSYNPNAVFFDGANDYLTRGADLTGNADSKKFTGSVWIRRNATGAAHGIYYITGANLIIQITSGGNLNFIGENAASTIILSVTAGTITDSNWHHILFSFDQGNSSGNAVYVDNVIRTLSYTTNTNDTFDFTPASGDHHTVGAHNGGSAKFNGDIADLWIDLGTYIDLSLAENRQKFRSPAGLPMYLGPNGSFPTGAAPDIFLSGATGAWETNKGTGGGFTESGALTFSSAQPGDSLMAGTAWTQVGNGLSLGQADASLAALNPSTLAFIDETNDQLRTYTWDGISWTSAGSSLSVSVSDPWITALDSDTIALSEDGGPLQAYNWNGSSWSAAGNPFAIASISNPTLAALNGNTIALADHTDDLLKTFTFDGTNWSQTGNSFTLGATVEPALAALNSNTVVLAEETTDQLRTYTWDGTNWTQTGSGLNVGVLNKAQLAALDSSTVALVHEGSTLLRIYSWNGATWTLVSSQTIGTVLAPAIAALDKRTVVIISELYAPMLVYSGADCSQLPYGVTGQMVYSSDYNVMQYCNGLEWVAMGPVGGTPPANGLVGHWKLDAGSGTTVVDSVGSNNGSFVGTPVWEQNSLIDKGVTTDGSGDYITFADNAVLDGTTNMTVSIWYKFINTNTNQSIFGKNHNVSPWGSWLIDYSAASKFQFQVVNNAGTWFGITNGPATMVANRWYHFVGVKEGANIKFYVNGNLEGETAAFTGTVYNSNAEMTIGGNGNYALGTSDDARIYNRALSPKEVEQLYHYGLSRGLGDVSANCANPSLPEGAMFYNADYSYMQYCNGERWVAIGR